MIAKLLYQTAKRYEVALVFPEWKRKEIMEATKDLNTLEIATLDNLVEIRKIIDQSIEKVIFDSVQEGVNHLKNIEKLIAFCSKSIN